MTDHAPTEHLLVTPEERRNLKKASAQRIIWGTFFALLAFRLIIAALLPIATDEAYYAMWGRVPDWGYFDHPPVIAWLAAFAPPGADVFWLRLPGILCATIAFWVQVGTYRMLGLSERSVATATVIVSGSLLGLLFGFLLTPDLPQILFWSLMAHELVAALYKDERRWLSLGIVLGLGFLSKYTIVLWLPVLLWTVAQNFALLKNRYLYGGAILCLLVISPHFMWQKDNGFIAINFQLNHGFKDSREVSAFQLNTDLPEPERLPPRVSPHDKGSQSAKGTANPANGSPKQAEAQTEGISHWTTEELDDSPEAQIERYFASKDEPKKKKVKRIKPGWQIVLDRINEYLGIVLAPLGFIAIGAVLYGLVVGLFTLLSKGLRRRLAGARREEEAQVEPEADALEDPGTLTVDKKSLLWVCSLSPVMFFGGIALFSKVEANWPAAYLITAAPLLTPWFRRHSRLLVIGVILNALAVVALTVHAHYPKFAKKPSKDRVLKESHGYKELSQALSGLEVPLFADTYQNTSMLNHYNPALKVAQWPGITRYSELVRRKDFGFYQHADIGDDDGFYILTDQRRPVKLQGYHPRWSAEIRDCLAPSEQNMKTTESKNYDGPLAPRQKPGTLPPMLEVNRSFAKGGYEPQCKRFAHSWYLTRYEVIM